MESKMRFRNHFSIIIPNLKGVLWLLVVSFAGGFIGEDGGRFQDVVISLFIGLGIVTIVLIYQIIIWAKTWITISEQSIIVECNTLFSRKKNTIGIANISNVNLEQGLFAMLIGTCKLKLDTNSLSTAESTDVTIVLKKPAAEELRSLLMARISDEEMAEQECLQNEPEKTELGNDRIRADVKDILLHGLFASRFLYTILIPLFIIFEFVTGMDEGDINYLIDEVGAFAAETIGLGLLILIALLAWSLLAALVGLLRNALKYWDFQIERQDRKLVIEYGLMNKVNYSIPIDKIQAVVLKQSFLARICNRYMVEVVNVGMNDDKQEAQAFLLPYCSREVLLQRIQKLLPEFADCLQMKAERQPKSIWIVWLWPAFLYLLFVGAILFGVIELWPKATWIVGSVLSVVSLAIVAVTIVSYMTEGTKFGDKILMVVDGSFSRKFVFVQYDKIQYVSLNQTFLAKRFGVQMGIGYLLASSKNRILRIPFFMENKTEILKMKLLQKGHH